MWGNCPELVWSFNQIDIFLSTSVILGIITKIQELYIYLYLNTGAYCAKLFLWFHKGISLKLETGKKGRSDNRTGKKITLRKLGKSSGENCWNGYPPVQTLVQLGLLPTGMKVKSAILFSMSLIVLSRPLARNVPELVRTLYEEVGASYDWV